MRDRLDGLWCDEDFADWYPRDGRPGLSPAQLATVCVLQFLLGLSDRQAAEVVRCRIDFKYAMAMELDDPGFHHSVLADFRDRLAEDDRADRLLDLALARLKEVGLVRERTTQRTDSTHGLAAVRDLTRLELITEAVRAALERPPWRFRLHLLPETSRRPDPRPRRPALTPLRRVRHFVRARRGRRDTRRPDPRPPSRPPGRQRPLHQDQPYPRRARRRPRTAPGTSACANAPAPTCSFSPTSPCAS